MEQDEIDRMAAMMVAHAASAEPVGGTPRTDALLLHGNLIIKEDKFIDLARQLERELGEAKTQCDRLGVAFEEHLNRALEAEREVAVWKEKCNKAWDDRDEQARQRMGADAEVAGLRADAERLDYLEREMELEQKYFRDCTRGDRPLALFRRNVPITRAAIDAALKEPKND